MPKGNQIQSSFAAGEVSPLMYGRLDVNKYAAGLQILENFVVTPQGAVRRRPGLEYKFKAKFQDRKFRVVRFRYLTTDYLLELGDIYIRIWDNQGNSVFPATITGSIADDGVGALRITTDIDNWQIGDVVRIPANTLVNAHRNEGIYIVLGVANDGGVNNRIDIGGTFYGNQAGVSLQKVVELGVPYDVDQIDEVNVCSSGGQLFFTHPKHQPRVLKNVLFPAPAEGAHGWVISLYENEDGPYMPIDDRNILLTCSNLTDTATMTSTKPTQFTMPADDNKFVEFFENNQWKLARITDGVSGASVTVDIRDEILGFIDPAVKISVKAANTPRTPEGGTSEGAYITPNRGGLGGTSSWVTGPGEAGFGYAGRARPTQVGGYVDRNTPLTIPSSDTGDISSTATAGTLTSTHSQVFSRSDRNKFFRRGLNNWVKLISFKSDSAMGYSNAGMTMKTVDFPTDIVTIVPGSRLLTMTINASAPVWAATDVGRHMRMWFTGQQLWCKITAFTNTQQVTARIYEDFPRNPDDAARLANDGRTTLWRMGAWSDTTGWPSMMTFHEQRAVFARTDSEPNGVWMSVSGDFYRHSPTEVDGTVLDSSGIAYPIVSNELQEICWLQASQVLLIGTDMGVWQARAATSILEPITPTNISITRQVEFGSKLGRTALQVGHSVIYLQRSGRKLREAAYSFEVDSWTARDISIASEHMLRQNNQAGEELVYQQEPLSTIWMRIGVDLVGITYVKDQEVLGWHRHELRSPTVGVSTDVYGMAVLRGATDNQDILYLACNSPGSWHVSALAKEENGSQVIPNHMDFSRKFSVNGGDTVIRGLEYLNGATVRVMRHLTAATADWGTYVVANGQITITQTLVPCTMSVGLEMTSLLRTLPVEGLNTHGTTQGKTKRIDHLSIRVWDTVKFSYGVRYAGAGDNDLKAKILQAGSYFTGDTDQVLLKTGFGLSATYYIAQTDAFPLNINALMPEVHTKE